MMSFLWYTNNKLMAFDTTTIITPCRRTGPIGIYLIVYVDDRQKVSRIPHTPHMRDILKGSEEWTLYTLYNMLLEFPDRAWNFLFHHLDVLEAPIFLINVHFSSSNSTQSSSVSNQPIFIMREIDFYY